MSTHKNSPGGQRITVIGNQSQRKGTLRKACYATLIIFLLLNLFSGNAFGENRPDNVQIPAPKIIEPKHVYALSQVVHREIEAIRHAMGCPKTNGTIFQVKEAEPREVFFQAVNLGKKVKRLHYYLTSKYDSTDFSFPAEAQELTSVNVWNVLLGTHLQIQDIKKEYNITTSNIFPVIEHDKKPSDVYLSILVTIRQVNLMLLEQSFTPSDVYQQITTAFYYMLSIYQKVPGLTMKEAPVFESGKIPSDVFKEILEVHKTVRTILNLSGLKTLDLTVDPTPQISPSDVYDMAVLITSELKYLHDKLPDVSPVYEAVYPGVKFPSHVFQRVVHLHDHLKSILEEVEKNPQWMTMIQ